MPAYYNENDPYCCAWLRNLIAAGHLPAGDVDERSIVDVSPDDLAGYDQCHFFAGIGGWSYALRLAGWPDDRPVWTGSCPCQPFSAAGAGAAADDERHLWPSWFPLIAERRPAIVFGEQVEAAIGWGWLDLVFADLESEGYACAATVLPACGVGAPHIRNRVWFVADGPKGGPAQGHDRLPGAASLGELGNAPGNEQWGVRVCRPGGRWEESARGPSAWGAADWLLCADGKARPVEPGTFPLAHGISGRVGRLRAYGNAIVPPLAALFVGEVMDMLGMPPQHHHLPGEREGA